MPDDFNQSRYWLERHEQLVGDPRSIGNRGLSVEDNLAADERVVAIVTQIAKEYRPAQTVLDLGCGYGRVSKCFTDLGLEYLGVDVSPVAIEQGRERNPKAHFEVSDLMEWSTTRTFDLVCVLYVFVHFVDDDAWLTMLKRSLSWIAPGGALLMADQFFDERTTYGQHVVARTLSEYDTVFRVLGFKRDMAFEERAAGLPWGAFKRIVRV